MRTCEGGEGFSSQVYDPVPELIISRRDEAAPLAVKGVADCKFAIAAVTLIGKVWVIYVIPQERSITQFLRPQLCPIY